MNMSGTAGVIILANATTSTLLSNAQIGAGPSIVGTPGSNALIQDLVGYGTSPDRYETDRAPAPGNTTVIKRVAGPDTDDNSVDFVASATGDPTPSGPAASVVDQPRHAEQHRGHSDLHSSARRDRRHRRLTPTARPACRRAWASTPSAARSPARRPPSVGSPFAVSVSVTDNAGVPATDTKNFTWNVAAAPVGVTPIADIQGTGTSSPIVGQVVATEGVVTASYPTGGFNGFYVQTPGPDTADASDAIFVYGGAGGFASYPSIGDSVDVTGTVGENFGKTELSSASWSPHGSSLGTVTPKTIVPGTDCPLPGCRLRRRRRARHRPRGGRGRGVPARAATGP